MRAVSLFSGAGGFEIGFGRAGIETILQAENDPWCLQVLRRHWPHVERVTDVRSVDYEAAQHALESGGQVVRGIQPVATAQQSGTSGLYFGEPAERSPADGLRSTVDLRRRQAGARLSGGIDLIYGGFPCQDLSVAGKRAGLRGERSGLFHEFARVVRELRPRWFAAENVPGLLSSADGADFGTVLSTMVGLGYGVAWRILDGRFFGVPQRRRRVFIVGCLGDAHRAAQVLAVCESCGGHSQTRSETREDIAPTLDDGARRASVELPMIAVTLSGGGHANDVNLPGRHHEDDENLVVARSLTSRNERIDAETENLLVAGAQCASDGHHGHSSPRGDGADNLIAFSESGQGWWNEGIGPLRAEGENRPSRPSTLVAGVRRLTPLECERLMGWPDGWTQYTADGREIPDSHRYRMCGNGVIATVPEWIGHRLMRVEAAA